MPETNDRAAGASRARPLVLGSTSVTRRELLSRLGVSFEVLAPDVDETPQPGEDGIALARRLAVAKARRVAELRPEALVIGSDQVGILGDTLVGKPGSHEAAVRQLQSASGRIMTFVAAVCLLDASSGRFQLEHVITTLRFRHLDRDRIEDYLRRDTPYQCAGAFKSESLGVALIDAMESEDPTAILGMPLIRLTAMLENEGVRVLAGTAGS
jgi:septum formation protein